MFGSGLTITYAAIPGRTTVEAKGPRLSKPEEAWFAKAEQAFAHKAEHGNWGPFSRWVHGVRTARKGRTLGGFSPEQLKFLKDRNFSFEFEGNTRVVEPKKGGELAELMTLHAKMPDLNEVDAKRHKKLLIRFKNKYRNGGPIAKDKVAFLGLDR